MIEQKAALFAEFAHFGQTRKYNLESYFRHCERVANRVKSVVNDDTAIAAAYLHDVVEDTCYGYDFIKATFGNKVAEYVCYLTHHTEGNRRQRKELDRKLLALAPPVVQTIKYADILDNMDDICDCDPSFAHVFMKEIRELMLVIPHGHRKLRDKAWAGINKYEQRTRLLHMYPI